MMSATASFIATMHGQGVKRTGDGVLIEFRSVMDAVRCAIEVQNGMVERNAGLPPERRIEFRVRRVRLTAVPHALLWGFHKAANGKCFPILRGYCGGRWLAPTRPCTRPSAPWSGRYPHVREPPGACARALRQPVRQDDGHSLAGDPHLKHHCFTDPVSKSDRNRSPRFKQEGKVWTTGSEGTGRALAARSATSRTRRQICEHAHNFGVLR
jgi:hypothetical protein